MIHSFAKHTCLSLGAGVQSTTLALMAARGLITPMPDYAIFADTGWEPKHVYEHLDILEECLPFPVYHVNGGNLLECVKAGVNSRGEPFSPVPWFTNNKGMGWRQCTTNFKILPVERKQRELLGYKPRQHIPVNSIEVWIGISTDEISRMKDAKNRWQTNRWPLIEMGLSRTMCLEWLASHNRSAPKSACLGCPYHTNAQWRDMKENSPAEWAQTCQVDEMIRSKSPTPGVLQFMHSSRVPLAEANLEPKIKKEFGFSQECEGMCGL